MTLPDIKPKLVTLIYEEDGQTTTEYILIAVVIVSVVMQFKKKFSAILGILFGDLQKGIGGISDPADF